MINHTPCDCSENHYRADVCLGYYGATPETWRWIPGWEGLYFCSDYGRVMSAPRIDGRRYWNPGRILAAATDAKCYRMVDLYRDGVAYRYRVHVLVLETFTGPRPEGMEARHLNGNPGDNRVGNLEWNTHRVNMLDKAVHGTYRNGHMGKTHCKRGHVLETPNVRPSALHRRGWRECLACDRAGRYVGRHTHLDRDVVADAYYRQVMGEGPTG